MGIKWRKDKSTGEKSLTSFESQQPERAANRLDKKIVSEDISQRKWTLPSVLTNRKFVITIGAAVLIAITAGTVLYWQKKQEENEIAKLPNPNNAPIIEVDGERYTADYLVAEDLTEQNTREYTLDEQISMVEDEIRVKGGTVELYKMLAELQLAINDRQKAIKSYENALRLLDKDESANDEQKKMLRDYVESLK